MKTLVEDESGEAILWSLAYGVAYAVILHKVTALAGPLGQTEAGNAATTIDRHARAHADQVMETLGKKAAAMKKAKAKANA